MYKNPQECPRIHKNAQEYIHVRARQRALTCAHVQLHTRTCVPLYRYTEQLYRYIEKLYRYTEQQPSAEPERSTQSAREGSFEHQRDRTSADGDPASLLYSLCSTLDLMDSKTIGTHMYTHLHTHCLRVCQYTCLCTYVHMSVHMSIHMFIHVSTCMSARMLGRQSLRCSHD